jgi:hypothetical protein
MREPACRCSGGRERASERGDVADRARAGSKRPAEYTAATDSYRGVSFCRRSLSCGAVQAAGGSNGLHVILQPVVNFAPWKEDSPPVDIAPSKETSPPVNFASLVQPHHHSRRSAHGLEASRLAELGAPPPVLGQRAQLGEHPLHAVAGGGVASVEVAGVLAAAGDQPALTPLKRYRQLADLAVVGDQHSPTSHEHPVFSVCGTSVWTYIEAARVTQTRSPRTVDACFSWSIKVRITQREGRTSHRGRVDDHR